MLRLTRLRLSPRRPAALVGVAAIALAVLAAGLIGSSSPGPERSPTVFAAASTPPANASPIPPSPSPTEAPTPSPSPALAYAPLDGMLTTTERAARIPVAVLIDDNIVTRPQSGFSAASIVYHAPADGGETRYLFVFQEQDASDVGPVRSTRPYFIRWAAEYRSVLAHYGGDLLARQWLLTIDGRLIYDLDALRGASGAYHRIRTRVAPFNAYTSTASLYRLADRWRFPTEMIDGLGAREFQDDAPEAERPESASVRVPYRTGRIDYTYDRAANTYLRSVAGRPQFDAATGERVEARNVIVLWVRLTIDSKTEPHHNRPVFHVVGDGKAVVFRDGVAISGRWVKKSDGDLTRIVDDAGEQIPLVRGPIYIQVVPIGTDVDYH